MVHFPFHHFPFHKSSGLFFSGQAVWNCNSPVDNYYYVLWPVNNGAYLPSFLPIGGEKAG